MREKTQPTIVQDIITKLSATETDNLRYPVDQQQLHQQRENSRQNTATDTIHTEQSPKDDDKNVNLADTSSEEHSGNNLETSANVQRTGTSAENNQDHGRTNQEQDKNYEATREPIELSSSESEPFEFVMDTIVTHLADNSKRHPYATVNDRL